MIFNIQRFSLHDGDGLRTTVFLKGCPLSCRWCSNPESQKYNSELMFDSSRCMGCGDCVLAYPEGPLSWKDRQISFDPEKQSIAENYKEICPTRALQIIGEDKSAVEICREVLKDRAFYKETGGVTLSGGEPLMQPDLCRDIAKVLKKENISVSMETCLHVPWSHIEKMIPWTDEFLCDVKHIDPVIFKEQTGGNLSLIWENLVKLEQSGAPVRVRIPVVYGFNHDPITIPAILERLKFLPHIKTVDFMPYHSLGACKYRDLGREYTLPEHAMTEKEIKPYLELAQQMKLTATSGG